MAKAYRAGPAWPAHQELVHLKWESLRKLRPERNNGNCYLLNRDISMPEANLLDASLARTLAASRIKISA